MISPRDIVDLATLVKSAVDEEEKKRRGNQLDDAVEHLITHIFDNKNDPSRLATFGEIEHAFGDYFKDKSDDLHRHLIRIRARRIEGSGRGAVWHLPSRGISINRRAWFVTIAVIAFVGLIFILINYPDTYHAIYCLLPKSDPLVCGRD